MGNAPDKVRSVRIDDATWLSIGGIAWHYGVPMSVIVREALTDFIIKKEKENG